jgi:hypothetical protein
LASSAGVGMGNPMCSEGQSVVADEAHRRIVNPVRR